MSTLVRRFVWAVTLLSLPTTSLAAEIAGKISQVANETITLESTSAWLPVVGDKVEILVDVPDVGQARVGAATVTRVDGATITARIDNSTGRIAAGQQVRIDSPNAVKRTAAKVPPLVGRTAADAKRAGSEAGFTVRMEVGIAAPAGVKPFTVYAQKPDAGATLPPGGEIVATLYANGETPSTPPPAVRPVDRPPPPNGSAFRATPQMRAIVRSVVTLLEKEHLAARPLDDDVSRRLFDETLRELDAGKRYFLQADITELSRQRFELDNQLKQGEISLFATAFDRARQRLEERVRWVEELLDAEHDFTVAEELTVDPEALTYARTEAEARELWRKRIKYELLVEQASGADADEARRRLRARYRTQLDRWKAFTDDELLELAMTLLASVYDANSSYISAKKWEDFVISNRQEMVGIGTALRMVDGNLRVMQIIVGSPADRDGRLRPDDRIIGVGEGTDGEMRDVGGRSLSEIVAWIRGRAGTVVRLQVVPDGQFESRVYEITRDKFKLARAQGTVIPAERLPASRQAKLGFIYLPSFYHDLDAKGETTNSASRDVRRLLEDFAKAGVDGVVLDLRNNTGGGLGESVDVTGLFLDQGGVLQVKNRTGDVKHYDDKSPGMAWNGPLVVLTSSQTSGGSEILVGALADYGRALIVGDTRTNGYGTVQQLVDLAKSNAASSPDPSQLGRLKVTNERFYRPLGDSTQLRGVAADVILPSLTELQDRQDARRFVMQFDKVPPLPALKRLDYGLDEKLLATLRQQSESRVASSPYFQRLNERIAAARQGRNRRTISLQREAFLASRQAEDTDEKGVPTLPGIPDVKANGYWEEALNVSLDYLARLAFAKAEADFAAKRYADGFRRYQAAVAADPTNAHGHYKLAWALATCADGRLRDGKRAVTHAEQAVERDRDNTWAYRLALAVAHAEAGNFPVAQQELKTALEAAPASQRATYRFLEQRFNDRQSYPK